MPKKIVDQEGNEHEVLTEDEIEDRVKEKAEEIVKEEKSKIEEEFNEKLEERESKIKDLSTDLETAKEALDDADEGTQDWANARKQIKNLENQLEEEQEARKEEREEFRKDLRKVRTSVFESQVDSMFETLSAGDEELREKIEHHYNRLGGDEVENEKEARELAKDAYTLATGGKGAPNPLNVARGANVGSAPKTKEPAQQDVVDLGKVMGVSEEDIEKFGNKQS